MFMNVHYSYDIFRLLNYVKSTVSIRIYLCVSHFYRLSRENDNIILPTGTIIYI